ncbi:DUF429 domain-containing protein [Mycolicibacterium sp. HS_4_1]
MNSRTVGIDLASQPSNTAVCIIEWRPGSAEGTTLACGSLDGRKFNDVALLALMQDADKVGIDAPFGWPMPFIEAISHPPGAWPLPPDAARAMLERRTTDRLVYASTGKTPLSVTTDRIAYCAMRCAALLSALGSPRDGSGLAVEAYPDAALRTWLPELFTGVSQSYKSKVSAPAQDRREALLRGLLDGLGESFTISDIHRDQVARSDDRLDALVCALVARAAATNQTVLPGTEDHRELARIEGWIHLPEANSLRSLVNARSC